MIFDIVIAVFEKFFTDSHRVFDQYLIANVLAFVKGFEVAIFLMAAVMFLLIVVGVTIRQARRLPKSYAIEIIDLDGRQESIDGIRQMFSTYEAAESYARVYRQSYGHQYRFRVIGLKESQLQSRFKQSR